LECARVSFSWSVKDAEVRAFGKTRWAYAYLAAAFRGDHAQSKTPVRDRTLKVACECYDDFVFNFGNPKTPGQWIGHIIGAIVALFLIWWMLRLFVL
jgi:hypothetical protein